MTYAIDATGPFYHGTRADLAPGDPLTPGNRSNYADRTLSWIYFSGTLDAAIWGCELARGEGRERIYVVEPTGAFEDDPNLTDKAPCSTCPRQVCARRSPATRPNPTAAASRCAWSARSRRGSRTRPSASPR
jgi:hypothetical protein